MVFFQNYRLSFTGKSDPSLFEWNLLPHGKDRRLRRVGARDEPDVVILKNVKFEKNKFK